MVKAILRFEVSTKFRSLRKFHVAQAVAFRRQLSETDSSETEAQANTFASFLLMPLDDFREQIRSQEITMALMRHLSDRYEVSITAAILKWLGITDKRAMIVVSKDGFIDWAWGEQTALQIRD